MLPDMAANGRRCGPSQMSRKPVMTKDVRWAQQAVVIPVSEASRLDALDLQWLCQVHQESWGRRGSAASCQHTK